ncbi:MAG: hypothetical protein IJ660_07565 [Alphaproteobacteria bacterium]|nr:hypothetical protein [Alphaproteobacteria bacterium]
MREPIDFKVEFFGTRTGWHGHFCQGTLKNGVLVGILSGDSLKPHDVVRGFVEGREEGLWQVVPLKLSHLEEGYILVVGERDRDGLTQCLYPNAHGIALVGWVKAGAQAPLEKNKKYLAHKGESGYFILD